jgi:hypothetical protein
MGAIPFHAFTSRYTALSRVLSNEIKIAQAFNPDAKDSPPQLLPFSAIWDTGATNTVITQNVVSKCSLWQIDKTITHTVNGPRTSNVYLVSLILPNGILFPSWKVTDGELGGNYDVLIGMDVIIQGDFAISNFNGKTTFSFRMPSLEETDYINKKLPFFNANEKYPGAGRNAPCPCKSGKKYKKCCGQATNITVN